MVVFPVPSMSKRSVESAVAVRNLKAAFFARVVFSATVLPAKVACVDLTSKAALLRCALTTFAPPASTVSASPVYTLAATPSPPAAIILPVMDEDDAVVP